MRSQMELQQNEIVTAKSKPRSWIHRFANHHSSLGSVSSALNAHHPGHNCGVAGQGQIHEVEPISACVGTLSCRVHSKGRALRVTRQYLTEALVHWFRGYADQREMLMRAVKSLDQGKRYVMERYEWLCAELFGTPCDPPT